MAGNRQYAITLKGQSPLLMHSDNIAAAEKIKMWREKPENKKFSVPGDDRSPAFTWLGCVYHDGNAMGIPAANIMRCLMEGGAQVLVPGGRGGKTFKAQTQSGMYVDDEQWDLLLEGQLVPMQALAPLETEMDFTKHESTAASLGFSLLVKRAAIGPKKHVRVRPKFERGWTVQGTVTVWDEQLTTNVLKDIFRFSGTYKGLGDWRPSSKTPGPYGRFEAEVKEV